MFQESFIPIDHTLIATLPFTTIKQGGSLLIPAIIIAMVFAFFWVSKEEDIGRFCRSSNATLSIATVLVM